MDKVVILLRLGGFEDGEEGGMVGDGRVEIGRFWGILGKMFPHCFPTVSPELFLRSYLFITVKD